MTDTIQTDAVTTTEGTDAAPAEEFLHLDPADIIIGTNVRTDLRPDHKEFRKSIKERGVIEAVTVYRNEDGQYVLLRGQRRTVTAADVGTPTGLIPARVVPQPAETERIGDQMVENIHRAGMRETEIVAGVEQLALLGVSAAQIAKRTSIDRPTVNAALAVTKADQTRNRLDSGDLTLEEAAIFAEHDPEAVERLEYAKRFRRSLTHEAQQLRDEVAEREADAAEVERLRGEGLPVLTAEEVAAADEVLRIERLLNAEGEPVPEEEWPSVPGARVHVVKEWVYPEDEYDESEDDTDDEADDYEPAEPYQQYVPVWVVTDLDASGLRRRGGVSGGASSGSTADEDAGESEEEAEARREERRRVIAYNKAWAGVLLTAPPGGPVEGRGGSGCSGRTTTGIARRGQATPADRVGSCRYDGVVAVRGRRRARRRGRTVLGVLAGLDAHRHEPADRALLRPGPAALVAAAACTGGRLGSRVARRRRGTGRLDAIGRQPATSPQPVNIDVGADV